MNVHDSLRAGIGASLGALAFSCALLAGIPQPAWAVAPAISYDAAADALAVGDGAGSTDLFADFKGVVSGDTIQQDVRVELKNVASTTRLYVRADVSALDADARAALEGVTLSAVFDTAEGFHTAGDAGAPHDVFASDENILIAEASVSTATTLHLTLSVPTSAGNELSGLSARIPWIITAEEDDGSGDSNAVSIRAESLVAYEGGLGTEAHDGADNLPEPAWLGIDWENADVKVDGQAWDVAERGLPFRWSYALVEDGGIDLVEGGALRGRYNLLAAPLEGSPAVTVGGKTLVFPDDGIVVDEAGDPAIVEVRDVTDDDAADALASDHFRPVNGATAPSLLDALQGIISRVAFAEAAGDSALDGDFNSAGTHDGDCDPAGPHAHVAAGTTFIKNGRADMPVNQGTRIALLWDDLMPGVLGEPDREGVLDAKARDAVGGFAANDAEGADGLQHRFKYLDLVDMNDGNLWVATSDGSEVTVFIPYFEGIDADDQIAVAYFEGLTRDYTVDMASADLDAEIANARAHALEVTKTADGILFDVPWKEFGPFELIWADADAGGNPEDSDGGEGDGSGEDAGDSGNPGDGGVNAGDAPHVDFLPKTGDAAMALAGAAIAAIAAIAACVVIVAARRRRS